MEKIIVKGETVVEGVVNGEALVTSGTVTFFGMIDFDTGTIIGPEDHELKGKSISGKILVFSAEVGSTGEPLGYYLLQRYGNGPKGIVCSTQGQMPVVCSIIGKTPFVYNLDRDPLEYIRSGDHVKIDGDHGLIEVTRV